MRGLLRHKLVVGAVAIAVAAFAGGAYAASQSNSNPQQAFLNDVAKRLNVTPSQLNAAVKGALIDRLNAEVKAGKLTQAQANKLEQRIQQGGQVPLFFGGGPGFGHIGSFRRGGPLAPGFGGTPAAAKYLGLTNAQLTSDLHSGKSLAQIATSQGKSVSGLEQAMTAAIKSKLDQAVSSKRISAAQEQKLLSHVSAMIDQLVNHVGLGGPTRFNGHFRGPGGWGPPPGGGPGGGGGGGVPPALFQAPGQPPPAG
jgi:hypothetical protein